MHLTQERFAGLRIEVVQEVCQQNEVIARSKLDVESATGIRLITIGNASSLRIIFGDLQHRLPIYGRDLSLRVVGGENDSKQTVPGRDVEDL